MVVNVNVRWKSFLLVGIARKMSRTSFFFFSLVKIFQSEAGILLYKTGKEKEQWDHWGPNLSY